MQTSKLHKQITSQYYWTTHIEPWIGTAECVYWAKIYCKERGYPIKSFWWSAYNWWITWSPFDDSWIRVYKDSDNKPKEGDIVFWDEGRGKYCHVAVANKFCTPRVLRCSDQNGWWKHEAIQPRFYNYDNVVWWFTRK